MEAVGGNGIAQERGERGALVFRKFDCRHIRDMATRRGRDQTTPLTLGKAAEGQTRLIVWCKRCSHQIEPDPAKMAARHGEARTVIEWAARLVCSNAARAKPISL
ncbi:MAG: hypothetical protein AB7H71_18805 [Alphaproteobacteria bacterium]